MSIPQKTPGVHKILPFASKITKEMPGICEARIKQQCFGGVCWDIDWKAQERQGQVLHVSCEAGMLAFSEVIGKAVCAPAPTLTGVSLECWW